MTEKRRGPSEEYSSQIRDELKEQMFQASRSLEEESFYSDLKLSQAMVTFQNNLGRTIDESRPDCSDFVEISRGYGQKQGVRITEVNPQEFWREEFSFFPKQELVQEGILLSEGELAISLYPNAVVVAGDKYYVRGGYRTEDFSLELIANVGKVIDLLETKTPRERALAISELLLVVDRVIDQKLQNPATSTP